MALSEGVAQTILAFIRAGTFDYVAAEAADVSDRTLRDWIARGEGTHPTRKPSPKLRKFAQAVRRAKAEARAGAEITVYQEKPAYWLAHAARSKPDREGWTEPPKAARGDDDDPPSQMEQWIAELDAEEQVDRRCSDPACPCTSHRRAEDGTRRPTSYSD